jgi:hypothetical protein
MELRFPFFIFITVQQFSFAPSGANLFVGEDKNKF